jgi:ParB-like nuclease domain
LPIPDGPGLTINHLFSESADSNDPEIRSLASSIKERGILEPLACTSDFSLLSGHRRYAAAKLAGLTKVPCRRASISSNDPRFVPLLREFNRQRAKTIDEVLREEIVSSADQETAYQTLRQYRADAARIEISTGVIDGQKVRARITAAKKPFLAAILGVAERLRSFWPLSDRLFHYQLLNDPPRIHASKSDSIYRNDLRSYKSLCELLTRARLAGRIPFEAIHDPTRANVTWNVHRSPGPFIRKEIEDFLKGYYRDLQASQPFHLEIIGEKNTIGSIIRPIAADYTIPYMLARGYSSLPPRHAMAERFKRTGKDKLVLLVVSDFDPEGDNIPHAFARSMRDDFNIESVEFIKVALTGEQVQRLNLRPGPTAKAGSSRRKRFVEEHGEHVFELEAVEPGELQRILRSTIESVMDMKLFRADQAKEREDAARLDGIRLKVKEVLKTLHLE